MTITLEGGVSINCIYYTIFSKVLCLSFCQIPFPYQDSHMQIICGNPDLMFTVNYLQKTLFVTYIRCPISIVWQYMHYLLPKLLESGRTAPSCSKRCSYIKQEVLSKRIQPNLVKKTKIWSHCTSTWLTRCSSASDQSAVRNISGYL